MDKEVKQWIDRAKSNLIIGQDYEYFEHRGIFIEDLCFNLQQAVEKALKALLLYNNTAFPKTHKISELLILLKESAKIQIPDKVKESARLSEYAVDTRYPDNFTPVTLEEYNKAVEIAGFVLG